MIADRKNQLLSENALRKFKSTYQSLVNTLADTYDDVPELQRRKTETASLSSKQWQQVAAIWAKDLLPHERMLAHQDEKIFRLKLPSLIRLCIPRLWSEERFTSNSKGYIWQYLRTLLHTVRSAGFSAVPKKDKDIAAPALPKPTAAIEETMKAMASANPILQNLFANVPNGLFDKITSVVDKYHNKLESGEAKLENLDLKEITKEVLDGVDTAQMSKMVDTVGSLLGTTTQ